MLFYVCKLIYRITYQIRYLQTAVNPYPPFWDDANFFLRRLFPNTTIAMVWCIKCIVLHPPKHQPVLTLHDKYSYRCWSPLTFIEHIGAVKFQLLSRCIWISKWQIFRPRTFSNNCIDLKFFHMSRLWHHTQRKSSSGKKASKVIKYLYTFWHHVFLSLFLA